MIFVTVGMHHQGFDRLIHAMDEAAVQMNEEVIMQIGAAGYEPRHVKSWFRFAEQKIIDAHCLDARVIVGHAGAGTVIGARHANRPLVVAARLASLNEHVNDHQVDLAEALAAEGKVITVANPTAATLIAAIAQAETLTQGSMDNNQLRTAITDILTSAAPRTRRIIAR